MILVAVSSAASSAVAAEEIDEAVAAHIRARFENPDLPGVLQVGTDTLYAQKTVPTFYERRLYTPAWTRGGTPSAEATELVRVVGTLADDGLNSAHYHQDAIEGILDEVRSASAGPGLLADADLLLTDAFLLVAAHFADGAINPETIDPEWHARDREVDAVSVLEQALRSKAVERTLRSLHPQQPAYEILRQELARLRSVTAEGGWPVVPEGAKLERGASGDRVAALRERLVASGALPGAGDDETFDEPLETAVRRFQERHGLAVDGIVGPKTLQALNVSAGQRARQIEINLERWRWLSNDAEHVQVLVNIAAFRVYVFDGDERVLDMRAVVGLPYRRTPVMSDRITYLVLNPFWHVPPSIARKDTVPRIRKEPDYLERHKMRVLRGWGAETTEVNPATVDWSAVNPAAMPYHFRQDPGPLNALGRVKFMFPNRHNVYLHDTSSPELFEKDSRDLSSGCIRVEKPFELAEFLLRKDPAWSRQAIDAALERKTERTVPLPEPVAVHIQYWTAWVEQDGRVQFRNDIYGRDARLDEALRKGPRG